MEKVIGNNKLIAEFMGWKFNKSRKVYHIPQSNGFPFKGKIEDLKYHSSWDWLMPVVEKIESLEIKGKTTDYYDVWIMPDAVRIHIQSKENEHPLILINKSEGVGSINHPVYLFEDKLKATYQAVVEFIKWYNEAS